MASRRLWAWTSEKEAVGVLEQKTGNGGCSSTHSPSQEAPSCHSDPSDPGVLILTAPTLYTSVMLGTLKGCRVSLKQTQ